MSTQSETPSNKYAEMTYTSRNIIVDQSASVDISGAWFDGRFIWTANADGLISKLDPQTFSLVGTFPATTASESIVSQGTHLFVSNSAHGPNLLTELLLPAGSFIQFLGPTSTLGAGGVCVDGTNVWVTAIPVSGNGFIMKFNASTGALIGTYNVGKSPFGCCFDGANIWIANTLDGTVTKLLAADGSLVGTYNIATGNGLWGCLFDGSNVWVAQSFTNQLIKINPADGSVIGAYAVDVAPQNMAFDGVNVWSSNLGPGVGSASIVNAQTGSLVATLISDAVAGGGGGIAWDGTNMWVGNSDGSVTVFTAVPLPVRIFIDQNSIPRIPLPFCVVKPCIIN